MEEKLCKCDVDELPFCECGCGGRVSKFGNRFINGHNNYRKGNIPHNKGKHPSEETLRKMSESHKGKKMLPQTRDALLKALTGREVSEESREKNRKSNTGLKRTSETRKNNSIAKKKFYKGHPEAKQQIREIVQAFYDNMDDPGKQIVKHHYIYDESDLTKYTTEMTRAKHAQIHAAMRKEGIIVPHINIKR